MPRVMEFLQHLQEAERKMLDDIVIVMNETRKEAWMVVAAPLHVVCRVSKYIKQAVSRARERGRQWDLTDDFALYEPPCGAIEYSVLAGYNELNFMTYNKEAHWLDGVHAVSDS